MAAAPLSGIVLAGGQSRRLGREKAGLTFGGRPLLHIVIERVSEVCRDVIVAASADRDPGPVPEGVALVRDSSPGKGPLAGIEAGLSAAPADFALVVACDMPFLSPDLLARMAAARRDFDALAPECGGRRHPLHAIYSRACLPVIRSLLAEGRNSVEELLARVRTRVMSEDEVRQCDPDGMSVFNLNDARDLEAARRLWAARTAGGGAGPLL